MIALITRAHFVGRAAVLAAAGALSVTTTSSPKHPCAEMASAAPDYAAWDSVVKAHVKTSEIRGIPLNVVDYQGMCCCCVWSGERTFLPRWAPNQRSLSITLVPALSTTAAGAAVAATCNRRHSSAAAVVCNRGPLLQNTHRTHERSSFDLHTTLACPRFGALPTPRPADDLSSLTPGAAAVAATRLVLNSARVRQIRFLRSSCRSSFEGYAPCKSAGQR